MSKVYLKIKVKSLAEEAKIIRLDENKYKRRAHYLREGEVPTRKWKNDWTGLRAGGLPSQEILLYAVDANRMLVPASAPDTRGDDRNLWFGLRAHRRTVVRSEARSAQLAYAYLRHRPYHTVEQSCWTLPEFTRVADLVIKYGPFVGEERFNKDQRDYIEDERKVNRGAAATERMRRAVVLKDLEAWYGGWSIGNRGKHTARVQKKVLQPQH